MHLSGGMFQGSIQGLEISSNTLIYILFPIRHFLCFSCVMRNTVYLNILINKEVLYLHTVDTMKSKKFRRT